MCARTAAQETVARSGPSPLPLFLLPAASSDDTGGSITDVVLAELDEREHEDGLGPEESAARLRLRFRLAQSSDNLFLVSAPASCQASAMDGGAVKVARAASEAHASGGTAKGDEAMIFSPSSVRMPNRTRPSPHGVTKSSKSICCLDWLLPVMAIFRATRGFFEACPGTTASNAT